MTLNPRFITTSDLEEYFVDSLTGLPLSGGLVYFYSDTDRNALKPVYELTGTAGNYTYPPLANPVTLSSVGTFQDGVGNNIVPYYYPYTGIPTDQSAVQELYFIQVYSSDGRLIFTRQGWPNTATSTDNVTAIDAKNFIPNGQFLAHNNGAAAVVDNNNGAGISGYTSGGTVQVTYIAQGGWEFVTSYPVNGTYNNTFTPYNPDPGVHDFPVYAFNMVFSAASGDAIKDLTITWPDANKFCTGDPPGQQPYTFYFQASSNDTASYNFSVYLIYSYGSGAGASAPFQSAQPLATFTTSNTQTPVLINIAGFPAGTGTIVPGANGPDDYVGLAIRCTSTNCNVQFTDFVLLAGNITSIPYSPVQTNAEMLSEGVAGWMPTPDPTGLDLYLPLVLTSKGMTFDHSIVGQIIAKTQINPLNNELAMNGTTYIASNNNAFTGIPYQRLMNFLLLNSPSGVIGGAQWNASVIPMFGTGGNFVTLLNATAALTTQFYVGINVTSALGAVTDGAGALGTGWTFTPTNDGSGHLYNSLVSNMSVPTAGKYWSFTEGSGGLVYNVWYSVNGTGTAPAVPSGANIQVKLTGTPAVSDVIAATLAAVNQYQFLLPNLAGIFLRSFDPTHVWDTDYATRTVNGIVLNASVFTGNHLGSYEAAAFLNHVHNPLHTGSFVVNVSSGFTVSGSGTVGSDLTTGTSPTGGTETRPVNFSVNYFIKY